MKSSFFCFLFFQNLTKQSYDFFCLVLTLATFCSGKVKETPISAITVHTITNSHAQLLCNVLFVQLELDLNLIFRFLCYDQITCVHFITRVIERVPDTFSIDQ